MATPSEKYVVKGRNGHLFGVFDDKKQALEHAEGCLVGIGSKDKQGYTFLPAVFVGAEVFIVKHFPWKCPKCSMGEDGHRDDGSCIGWPG